MSLNGVGLTESIVHARTSGYPYRAGMGMINSAEFVVMMDDFVSPVTTNLPLGWDAVVIDTGATVVTDTTVGSLGATGAMLFDSDGAAEGACFYGEKCLQLTTGKSFFICEAMEEAMIPVLSALSKPAEAPNIVTEASFPSITALLGTGKSAEVSMVLRSNSSAARAMAG